MPLKKKGGGHVARVGFGPVLEEKKWTEDADPTGLAAWILDWVSLHGEASRARSATPMSE